MRSIFVYFLLIFLWSFISISHNGSLPFFVNLDFVEISISLLIEILGIYFILKKSVFTLNFKIVLFFCFYSCFIVLLTASNLLMDFRCVLWWPIIYMFFYTASYRKYISLEDNFIKYYFILLFSIAVVLFIYTKVLNPLSYSIGGQEYFIRKGNLIFYVITLLPIAFIQKQSIRYVVLLLGFLAAIYSFKRSAILVSVLLLFLSLWFDLKAQNRSYSRYLIVVFFLLLTFYVVQNIDTGINEYLLERFNNMSDGGGSGRTDIYNKLLSGYFDQNIILMIFGSGYNSVMKYQNISMNGDFLSAHNDYLEYLYDFGIIGLVFYIWFTYILMKCILKSKDETIRSFTIAVFLTFLFLGLVSHLALYPTYICYLMIMIGIIKGKIDLKIINK